MNAAIELDAKDKAAFALAVFERVVLLEGLIIDYEFRSLIAQPLACTTPSGSLNRRSALLPEWERLLPVDRRLSEVGRVQKPTDPSE
jgi:hypothetical protein